MYAVIFKAEIHQLDHEYSAMAEQMRDLAIEQYGCKEFTACTEGNLEIAISYWETEEQIQVWKQDPKHLIAQEKGKSKWYKSYSVQVVELLREYGTKS